MKALRKGATWMRALTLAALLSLPLPGSAQGLPTRANMPEEVVLVLKRVGEDTVQTTTGVVVGRARSGAALVVVPASFVQGDDPVFVLDVGTDLLLDGLPAERFRQSPDSELAVLAVDGMQRRPVKVTFNPPDMEHEVRLAAWPPADMMASGAMPYWIPVDVQAKRTGEPQQLLENATVPNLTGPLIDLCGQWTGMVVANGKPGIADDPAPRVILNDELLRVAETLQLDLRLESCMQVAPVGGIALSVPPRQAALASGPGAAEATGIQRLFKDARLGTAALVFLLSALVSGMLFWYLVKRRAAAQRRKKIQRTLAMDTVTFSATGLPTRMTREEPKTFNPGTRPPGTNGWLRIEGTHADGRPLRAVTAITEGKFQAVIGRAGVALSADGPGISRKHAVIVSEGGRLTISDLGSRNGTFVNGVRCQPDEVFFIEPGDKLLIGAAEITVSLKPAQGPAT